MDNNELVQLLQKLISQGESRLAKPVKNGEVQISDIIRAVRLQKCIRVKNYQPDPKNKHLDTISLGPSYLEQMMSRTIDDLEGKSMSAEIANYMRDQIGLQRKRKPQVQQQLVQQARQKIVPEDIQKIIEEVEGKPEFDKTINKIADGIF
jgi:hypothetical protein